MEDNDLIWLWGWLKRAFRKPKPDLDEGRIKDVEEAWELAVVEEARMQLERAVARDEERRLARITEDDQWIGALLDDTFGTGLKPFDGWSAPEKERTWYPATRSSWADNALERQYRVLLPDTCKTLVKPVNVNVMRQCELDFGHEGDHSLGKDVVLERGRTVEPILVHELVGEIHGQEDLKKLRQALKDKGSAAKRARLERKKLLDRLGRHFE